MDLTHEKTANGQVELSNAGTPDARSFDPMKSGGSENFFRTSANNTSPTDSASVEDVSKESLKAAVGAATMSNAVMINWKFDPLGARLTLDGNVYIVPREVCAKMGPALSAYGQEPST